MFDVNTVLQTLTVILVVLGGYGLVLLKAGTEAAVKASAEEAAKATVQQFQWPAELTRELQKSRAMERQELRFRSYGALWKELRPLAIYDATVINKTTVTQLFAKLSDWYFSECGGLLLTPQARDFYFALQDLLRSTSRSPEDWTADRSAVAEGDEARLFRDLLQTRKATNALSVLDYLSTSDLERWESTAADRAKMWRTEINSLAATWNDLDPKQHFVTLQQVGSVLRTSLVNDLESRLR